MKTTIEILRDTKSVLGTRGWIKGDYVDPENIEGAVCLRGALNVAAGAVDPARQPDAAVDAHLAVWRALWNRGVKGGPIRFNDTPGRTLDEVYALLDEAIVLAEAVDAR